MPDLGAAGGSGIVVSSDGEDGDVAIVDGLHGLEPGGELGLELLGGFGVSGDEVSGEHDELGVLFCDSVGELVGDLPVDAVLVSGSMAVGV